MGEDEENQFWLVAVVGGVLGMSEERKEGRYDKKRESQRIYHTNSYRSIVVRVRQIIPKSTNKRGLTK